MLKRAIIAASFILVFLIATSCWAEDAELGSFRLPRDITYEGKTIAKGPYNLDLESTEGEAYLLIKKGEEVLCREMAIIIPAKLNYTEAKITVTILTRDDDNLLRVRAFVGNNTYSAYYKYIK